MQRSGTAGSRTSETYWIKSGECKKCGACCRHLILGLNPNDARDKDFCRFLALRGVKVHWFDGTPYADLPVKCQALTSEGLCRVYEKRPRGCAVGPLNSWEPQLHKKCGYKFTRSQ